LGEGARLSIFPPYAPPLLDFYVEGEGAELVRGIVAALRPVFTDGHVAMARATDAAEYCVSLNNYVNL
jgi:hypothetical protein